MEQEKFEIWMMEYLSGDLDKSDALRFENYVQDHPKKKEEFEAIQSTWKGMDNIQIPEPSEKMDATFFDMLHSEVEKQDHKRPSWLAQAETFFGSFGKPQLAFGVLLLGIGLGVGFWLNSNDASTIEVTKPIVANNETEQVREQLVLTLLEQPSANKRLQAVSEASKLNDANDRIIEALFTTLNKDPNVNVRLVAVESLARYVEIPEVRMGLVKSIALQDSPLVQIALADLMVALQEKTSIESMKQLLEKPDINTTVKQKLEESINHII